MKTIDILLVDDEPRNLEALEAILDEPAYRLLRAEDAEKALRLLLENDVAAIVLDIKMPVVSGFELANIIKGTKKFRQIPIVFLTAHLLDDRDILAGYGAGAVDYLTKPVNPQILRHKVGVFADLFRKTRALAELNETLEARVQERTADLEESEAALRLADRQKDVFLATLAHELRNPLAPLRTGLAVLMQEEGRSPAATNTLAAMNRQLDHMVRLVDDLLDVSRIRHGTLEIRTEPVDLVDVVRLAIETMTPQLQQRHQSVHIAASSPMPAVADRIRIAQVVSNLLSNASKHSPSGATISVTFGSTDDRLLIRIDDAGRGIPVDQLERIFELFAKLDGPDVATQGGLGIGLALSRQIAELHGGTLTGKSEGEGKGATFTLTLPASSPVTNPSPAPPVDVVRAPPAKPLRIIIVEDNLDSAHIMSMWLTHLGHEVILAHTGPAGLAAILESRPALVLCDIGLPEMDGVEVCRRVVQEMPMPPVMVALTGWGMSEHRSQTIEAGFRHHLVKPVALDAIEAILQSVAAE